MDTPVLAAVLATGFTIVVTLFWWLKKRSKNSNGVQPSKSNFQSNQNLQPEPRTESRESPSTPSHVHVPTPTSPVDKKEPPSEPAPHVIEPNSPAPVVEPTSPVKIATSPVPDFVKPTSPVKIESTSPVEIATSPVPDFVVPTSPLEIVTSPLPNVIDPVPSVVPSTADPATSVAKDPMMPVAVSPKDTILQTESEPSPASTEQLEDIVPPTILLTTENVTPTQLPKPVRTRVPKLGSVEKLPRTPSANSFRKRATVIWDYDGPLTYENKPVLPIKNGNEIAVMALETEYKGWGWGELNGMEGYFPLNYTKVSAPPTLRLDSNVSPKIKQLQGQLRL